MKFVIRGEVYEINTSDVVKSMRNGDPEPIRRHFVKIDNREFPVKQVITQTIDIPKISFTSMDAYNILRKLGFKIFQKY